VIKTWNSVMAKILARWVVPILYSFIFLFLISCLYAEKINEDLSNSIIRLHIVANSDSDEDQALKYRIRDAVIAYMQERMDELKDKENAKTYVAGNINELESVANSIIVSEGLSGVAKVSFGKFPFPTKKYGSIALPAGYYEALKIEIGNAEGRNWWCVMFPPLCFVNDTRGDMDEESMALLKNELSEKELDIILSADSGNEIPVEIKFKIVELLQGSKIKLASLFRGIIKLN